MEIDLTVCAGLADQGVGSLVIGALHADCLALFVLVCDLVLVAVFRILDVGDPQEPKTGVNGRLAKPNRLAGSIVKSSIVTPSKSRTIMAVSSFSPIPSIRLVIISDLASI
jgi:hypothetical protein